MLHQTFILWIVKALFLKHDFFAQRRVYVYNFFVYFIIKRARVFVVINTLKSGVDRIYFIKV